MSIERAASHLLRLIDEGAIGAYSQRVDDAVEWMRAELDRDEWRIRQRRAEVMRERMHANDAG